MAVRSKTGTAPLQPQPSKPKRTRQGKSLHTSLAATSRNGRKKRYQGQGK
jgi:hypothetical protein